MAHWCKVLSAVKQLQSVSSCCIVAVAVSSRKGIVQSRRTHHGAPGINRDAHTRDIVMHVWGQLAGPSWPNDSITSRPAGRDGRPNSCFHSSTRLLILSARYKPRLRNACHWNAGRTGCLRHGVKVGCPAAFTRDGCPFGGAHTQGVCLFAGCVFVGL